ncbi:LysR substrate-binding domain-containing protein [Roseobacter weihaiensis]|uniref:LysR substrate-binding domain-containing protein n=1 Tax=Roseobacter weihaiensis TaxID=2763262 RepID=UPI001D0ADE13|nr:LysR substrate-binding domain-containing protein [Roseobacter sp. H9]
MPLRFTLRQLEYFVAVGEEGSIAQASERVNVSSPSISAAISQLEGEFGLPLFVRKHAHGLSLTQAGLQFLSKAQRVLAEAEALNRLADNISGKVQGPLKIGCLLTFAQVLLPAIRRKFEQSHPDTRVSQIEADQLELIEKLRRAEIDVALSYDLEIPPDLDFVPLRALSPYAMMAADHPLADRDAVSVAQLLEHPMVLLDLPFSSDYFLSFFDQAGRRPQIVERTRDMAVMRSLVANGFGFGIANIRPHTDLSPDGRPLRFVPLKGPQRPMRLGLILPQGARSILTVSAFIDHTAQTIATWGYPGRAIKQEV